MANNIEKGYAFLNSIRPQDQSLIGLPEGELERIGSSHLQSARRLSRSGNPTDRRTSEQHLGVVMDSMFEELRRGVERVMTRSIRLGSSPAPIIQEATSGEIIGNEYYDETEAFFARCEAINARLKEEQAREEARQREKRIPPAVLKEMRENFRRARDGGQING